MHFRFLHKEKNALDGRTDSYLHRHPVIKVREGMYPELKKLARKKGYKNVNALIAAESATMLMNLFLEALED